MFHVLLFLPVTRTHLVASRSRYRYIRTLP
jgi:hypothetical protein